MVSMENVYMYGRPALQVKEVCDVGVDSADLLPPDAGNDVLYSLAAAVLASLEAELGVGQVPVCR